ncbi:TOTE conflict system archaeo-eukaryotic primase domain-containing protein [Paenibacillus hamazuiensis]|uniref:TOTE conflict system archaeo-eukaryotic primase domain-containing protein n=1 Tax=Paenibacillus hamazuiensis TaxID=2936508 RepID=UPI00200CBB94|nr:hypothetical protein [Paenibacillus hamazuiensis]
MKATDKLFDLYLIQNIHYLLQFKGGHYITRNDREKPLRLFQLRMHLDGKTTVGTFSGKYLTKFICFDVDYPDRPQLAKWVTYKLTAALDQAGLHDYAVSTSGGKGYHVELFLDKAISTDAARKFYALILRSAEISESADGKVEYRPSTTQGVKLPLGVHQKTGNFCGFCRVDEGLRVMDREESTAYFLAVKKTNHAAILAAIEDERAYDNRAAADMENAVSRYQPLTTYDQSESYTLSRAAERYEVGLTGPGQRHNSFLLLARLMNHNGVEREAAVTVITEWLEWQDRRFYDSDWNFCMKDLQEVVDYVYDGNLTLTMDVKDLTVSFAEIDAIIRRCPQKNHKALTYAMLVHSKRWAGPGGSFYMTYDQMAVTAGIDIRTAKRQIDQLAKLGVIEIVRRNQRKKGTMIKKPNVYRMTITGATPSPDEKVFMVTGVADMTDCIRFFYDPKELRTMLPRRQYASLFTGS